MESYVKKKVSKIKEYEDSCNTNIVEDQVNMWSEGCSEEEMEKSLFSSASLSKDQLDQSVIADVSILLQRMADKADRLIGNFTSNLAECWMSIRCKFDGGKQINRTNRGSWHCRVYGGALRKNLCPEWACKTWENVTNSSPGKHFESIYE